MTGHALAALMSLHCPLVRTEPQSLVPGVTGLPELPFPARPTIPIWSRHSQLNTTIPSQCQHSHLEPPSSTQSHYSHPGPLFPAGDNSQPSATIPNATSEQPPGLARGGFEPSLSSLSLFHGREFLSPAIPGTKGARPQPLPGQVSSWDYGSRAEKIPLGQIPGTCPSRAAPPSQPGPARAVPCRAVPGLLLLPPQPVTTPGAAAGGTGRRQWPTSAMAGSV